MRNILELILPGGILAALSQDISPASKLGILKNGNCLRYLSPDLSEIFLLEPESFEALSQILPVLTGQYFFHTLTTRMVESMLLGMARELFTLYVFVFDFWE